MTTALDQTLLERDTARAQMQSLTEDYVAMERRALLAERHAVALRVLTDTVQTHINTDPPDTPAHWETIEKLAHSTGWQAANTALAAAIDAAARELPDLETLEHPPAGTGTAT